MKARFALAVSLPAALLLAFACSQSSDEQVPYFVSPLTNGGAPGCPMGALQCGAACVDVTSDVNNCGGCGTPCGSGQLCQGGACVCQPGQASCGSRCVDVSSSPDNCGTCGTVCPSAQVCSLGACSTGCAAGLSQCGQSCVNLTSSIEHCGNCGATCGAGQACNNSACGCAGGLSACGSECVDTRVNSAHCGNCTTVCAAGQGCNQGVCACSEGQVLCSGACMPQAQALATCGQVAGTGGTGGGTPGTGGSGGAGGVDNPPPVLPTPRDLSCAGINVAAADVISDFAQATPVMYKVGERGNTPWIAFAADVASDPLSPGNTFAVDGAMSGPCNSGGSLHVTSPGNSSYGVGFGVNFMPDVAPRQKGLYNARAAGYTGIGFWAQCRQETEFVFFKVPDGATDADVATPRCSYDGLSIPTVCNQYGVKSNVLLQGQWVHHEVYFDEALQDWDSAPSSIGNGLNASALTAFQIQMNTRYNRDGVTRTPNRFDCWIDDVHFIKTPTPATPAPRNVTSINGNTIAPGGYYTQGNQIRDASGTVHRFRGFARPSFEWDPSGFGITREDLRRMRATGANVVRFSLTQGFWLSNHPQYNPLYEEYVDRAVKWGLQAGMDVILDLHWSGLGTTGQQQMPDGLSVVFWQQVANKYKGDGRVMFELYNEPHTVSPAQWRNGNNQAGAEAMNSPIAGMQDLYNAVRATGANNLVLVGGLDFAYDLDNLLPAFDLDGINIAYVTHPYRFKNPPPPAGYDASAANYPIIATEFGDADVGGIGPNDCGTAIYQQVINDFETRGMSWTGWAWLVDNNRCSFPTLLDRYDGTPTPPGQVVFNALRGN